MLLFTKCTKNCEFFFHSFNIILNIVIYVYSVQYKYVFFLFILNKVSIFMYYKIKDTIPLQNFYQELIK